MPSISAGAEDAKLLSWLRQEGETVRKREEIAEIETDKATMAIEAPHDGIIGSILAPAGGPAIRIDSPIAILLRDGESFSGPSQPPTNTSVAVGTAPPLVAVANPMHLSILAPSTQEIVRTLASPLARRLAKDRRIDLAAVRGTGPRGRVVRADVERSVAKGRDAAIAQVPGMPRQAAATAVASEPPQAALPAYAGRNLKEVSLDGMRRTIADRLTRSKQTVPHYYLRRDIRIDALLALRAEINERLAAGGVKLSLNDFFIKACALALQQVPDCNAIWAGDRILQFEASDIAVAVSVQGGLYTPILRDAHTKSISTLSREMRHFAERARDRKLLPAQCEGGSMTLSNLGMYGVENFDAIINPPQSAILAVGAAMKKIIFDEASDSFVSARVNSVTLSVDHRVLDGALAADLLNAIAQNIEQPLSTIA
jgi:pyruvate dehydrogenase E2 component (dihydrolipoamide acetyltransferase)